MHTGLTQLLYILEGTGRRAGDIFRGEKGENQHPGELELEVMRTCASGIIEN